MKLQQSAQGIQITSDFSLKPYFLLGCLGLLGLPIIKSVIDLIIRPVREFVLQTVTGL
jgi:hypothetical protein